MKNVSVYQIFVTIFGLVASQTVSRLNTTAYLGRWYQMYSDFLVEATFENSSFCDTADYGLWPNGTISVLNRERQYSVDGPERVIHGWAAVDSPSEPGQLTVHLQTVGLGAPYWVYELGPATYDGWMYEYSIVSDPLKATLFVLARNVSEFYVRWNVNVSTSLRSLGFTGFLNTPIATVQNGCTYW